jgi:transketolase
LREISRKFHVPLSTLKHNASVLKDLNLIRYGLAPNFSGVELTELGKFISSLIVSEDLTVLGTIVQTVSGFRPIGSVIRDLRKSILRMIAEAGSGHLGASLSAIDIMAILYFMKMRHKPSDPGWPDRDRFILSKGHAAPALYAVLAEAGYFPADRLTELREIGSILQGHPDMRIPGVEASTGSLGQGLSIAVGMAISGKMDGSKFRVYSLLGDGELNEGQIWEAALTAAHYNLDNLTVIVDFNGFQLSGKTEEIKSVSPIGDKWRAFGWEVVEANGHEPASLLEALDICDLTIEKPSAIIAKTTKGKGISFMEGNIFSRKAPNADELKRALSELT